MYAKTAGLKPNYTIMDETDAVALMRLARDKSDVKEIEERFPQAKMCKSILSYSINCNKSIRDVILWKYEDFDNDKIISKLKQVFKIYEKKKADDGLVDFDDLIVYWSALLDEKIVARLIAKRIRYVLVDEYQDTNWLQDDIVYKIASQNPERNVIVVGDDAQSIYAFRGANFKNIMNFKKKYKGCRVFKITFNYRSTPEILTLANDSISHNKIQFKKAMQPTRPKGLKPFQLNVGDDTDQARFIVNQVLKLREEGFELEQMAILVRAARHTMRIELELQAKNIPYEVRAGVAFFEKAHIKDLLAHLRIIENPYDELAWSRIFKIVPEIGTISGGKIFTVLSTMENPIGTILKPNFFSITMKGARINSAGKRNLKMHVQHIKGFTAKDSPSDVILELIKVVEDHIKISYENWQDRLDDLKQLAVYAQSFTSIRKFLEILSLNQSEIESRTTKMGSKLQQERPLVLSTVHRAKGLEWRAVFIPMLSEDAFPSSRAVGDPESFEEERRVFYVAITRAKDQLYLISPAILSTYRGPQTARLSQFISELQPKVYKKSSVKFIYKKNRNNKRGFQTASDLL
jgi:DNA helicase-2/ATP-dependent DNA helicase PcrA